MDPGFERSAVEVLADYAAHWAEAPMLELPAVVAAIDQFGAGTLESMHAAGMTESERIAFAFGYYTAVQNLHDQLESNELHDGPYGALCETAGLFAGTVARKALDP